MTGWDELERELDLWGAAGRTATLWWRDDDATAPSQSLDRALALQRSAAVPLALAVIPGRATQPLCERLSGETGVFVMQHGWRHDNHAPPGAPKAELGSHRPASFVLGELARGRLVLDRLFGGRWLKVLVPPHNRLALEVAYGLPVAGYAGLSTFGARAMAIAGLIQVNAHCDIMNWTTRAFAGEAAALRQVVDHLARRRLASVDPDEPTGFLTHHLAHDAAAWSFCETFFGRVKTHEASAWLDVTTMFKAGPASRA
jgi:hypothetical protein